MKATLVTYHYVRPIKSSSLPQINGLELEEFTSQLKYFSRNYDVVSLDDLSEIVCSSKYKSLNPLVLTFDDGYKEHAEHVLPILKKFNFSGAFFPVVDSCINGKVLDVNKIHYMLASIKEIDTIYEQVISYIKCFKEEYKLELPEYYLEKYFKVSRFGDDSKTMFVKKMLQQGFPVKLRKLLCENFCKHYLGLSELELNRILYMNLDEVRELVSQGMIVGGHSATHPWLNYISEEEVEREIQLTEDFLFEVYNNRVDWIMCYPYGAYSENVINALKRKKCKMALTTRHGIYNTKADSIFEIPRLDTKNLPCYEGQTKCSWLSQALEK